MGYQITCERGGEDGGGLLHSEAGNAQDAWVLVEGFRRSDEKITLILTPSGEPITWAELKNLALTESSQ